MATFNKSTEKQKQTIVGTGEDDLITGSAFADTIRGNGGNDVINAGAGNDIVYGGNGNDSIAGDAGNDIIYGDAGEDRLSGGLGADRLFGGDNNDILDGGEGNDLLDGGAGNDMVDYSQATSGIRVNTGISGPQTIGGRQGGDTLVSIEQVRGSMFNDIIEINRVEGSGAVHFASGGNGDDQITINANVNIGQADGGLGDDTILITGVRGGVVNAGEGNDTIQIQAVNTNAGSGVIVRGNQGDDFISVEGGFDHSVQAGTGDDVIYVDNAVQRELDGGAGDDMLVIQGSAELGTVEEPVAPAQFIQNIKGMETIVVLGAQDTIIDLTNDVINTDTPIPLDFIPFVDMTDNTIIGGDGRDDIRAGAGDDVLIGGLGDDTLNGGTGDDVLIAGEGDDTLVGGEGQDTLILSGNVIDYVVKLRAVEATQSIANPAYAIALAEVTEAKQAFYVQFNMLNNKYGVNDGALIIPSGIPGDDAEALQNAAFENSQNPNVNGLYESSDFEPGSELSNLFLAFDFAEGTLEDTPSLIESQVVVDHEVLQQQGLLGEHVNIVHGHALTDDQLKRFCDLGMSFSAAAESEMSQGHGHPLTGRLRALGRAPSLGVDLESVMSGDMLSQARIALGIQRSLDNVAYREAHGSIPPTSTITTRQALSWVTIEGARMLQQSHRIGSLAAGKQAHPALPSMLKYYGAELNKRRWELMMAVFGADALEWEGERSHDGKTARDWLRTKANSIEGGTSEVQLNIIAKHLLQLPGA